MPSWAENLFTATESDSENFAEFKPKIQYRVFHKACQGESGVLMPSCDIFLAATKPEFTQHTTENSTLWQWRLSRLSGLDWASPC